MGHARDVGRGLAVALALGYAVAATPEVALAAPPASDTSSTSTHEQSTPVEATGGENRELSTEPKTDTEATRDGEKNDDAAEKVNGTPTTTGGGDIGNEAGNNIDDDEIVTDAKDSKDSTSDDTSNRRTSKKRIVRVTDDTKRLAYDAGPEAATFDGHTVRLGAQLTTQAADTDAPGQRTAAAPETVAVMSIAVATAPPVAVVPAPPPDLDDLLEEPHTHLVGMTVHMVDAVLDTLLAPLGPGTPAQSPLLWTMLAFVRDEFRRIVFPNVSPGPATPTLVDAPNLLVNPGAEFGDPSLSGYSSVSIPGWAATGTPTVIKYGTLRRFPVPTPSPGPVLPALLAFPSHDGAITDPTDSGQQFFGGGPVASSTLTQVVDLSGAADAIDNRSGGVRYELGGDLGGFLIDPSRGRVAVDFLDENGATLGTGTLKPVTAWDRLFATGFIHREIAGTIPVGARSARLTVSFNDFNPVLGNYNNAYADNLTFKVDADGLAAPTPVPPVSTVGALDHVFMVYLENKGVSQIIGSRNAPYLNQLIDTYGYASNYYGLTHPSDPNYYPIIGGSDFGFNYNCPSNCFPAGTPNLADSIEAAHLTWAGYAEGGGGYTAPTDRLPFLAFSDIYNDPQRVATHLFDISQLEQDLADPASAANFVWFAADDATNMEGPTDFPLGILHWVLGFLNPFHQYNVKAGDEWLRGPLTTIFDSPTWQDPTQKSAVFVTFDEDYNNLTTGVGNEGNHIVMVVIPSPGAIDAGMRGGHFVADDHYNHYSLQRTIEDSLGLAPLTNNDRFAYPMNEFWV